MSMTYNLRDKLLRVW